jgi:PAS domain S-box-containing protein
MRADYPGKEGSPPDSPRQRSRGWQGYLLAVAVTLATLGGRLIFASWFGDRTVLVLFILPIFMSAYVGGLGPGLVSTLLVALGTSYFLIPPIHSFAMERSVDVVQWMTLNMIGLLITVLTESLHTARQIEGAAVYRGQSLATERKVQVGFGLALVFLVVISAASIFSVTRLRQDTGWATHTEEVISSLRLLLSNITDVETAERGYIITGAESYLIPYNSARGSFDGELAGLRKLTADNLVQQRQLDRLAPLIAGRVAAADQNVALRRVQELTAAQATLAINEGKTYHDRIRELIAEMEATEQGLLLTREGRAKEASVVTRTVIIGGGTLAFVFVAVALFIMNREFAVRHRAEAALREGHDQLEARVRERTAELELANRALRSSEEIFSNAFRHSPDCLAIVRLPDRTVIRANEAVCRLWGSTPEEVIGKPTLEYTNWVNEAERLAFMQTLQEKGENLNHEADLRMKDGRQVRFNISSRIISLEGQPCILSVMSDITERKKSEIAAARLAAIVEFSDDAIIGKDLQGVVTSWNAGAEKTFGYRAAEMIGQPIARLIPPERQHEETEIIARVLRGESVRHLETVRVCKDGSRLDVSVMVSAVRDSAGTITGASKVARDITERKRAEAALRDSRARLDSTLAAGSIGTWTWDIGNDRLSADEFTARAFSVDVDAAAKGLPAATYLQAVVEEDQAGVSAGLAQAIATCGNYDIEYRIRQKNGEFRWLQAKGRVEGDAAGKAVNFHGAVIDITARKLAEAAVRESEEYFRFLNDLALATRALADPAQIMAVTARMLGGHLGASRCAYADVEADGERFTILHDYTDGCSSTVGQYQLSLFGPRAVATLQRGETLIICNVGAELLPGEGAEMFKAIGIEAIITCPLVKEGTLRAMMAVHQTAPRDWRPGEITIVQDVVERCWAAIERRTAEEKIRQLNVELEQRVIERTAQLQTANRQLEAANKELEAFSYSVSHDLRAPLRAVDGFSQAVLEDYGPQLPADGQRQLQTIRDSAQRMGELIDDLLAFARLSRQPLARRVIDTGQLVREVLGEMETLQLGRAIEIRVGALPVCEGDRALLKQVWINLIANAFKYTRRRAQAVVEIGCEDTARGRAYFVRDNGTGFDMQYAGKLFGVFQRLHRTEEYEGTGVGLAIVQRVIHRHGGRVWAEAAVDRGATFYFTLNGEIKT